MPLWKIIIEGQTAFDVQGVGLRETVERIAVKVGVTGFVKNRKNTKLVEVVCKCENEAQAHVLRNALNKNIFENHLVERKQVKVLEPIMYNDTAIDEDEIKDFNIIREDDLTEMVWALQNAGRALLLQVELKQKQQFRAISAEIDTIRGVMKKIYSGNPYKENIPLIAIEGFLKEPPSKCDGMGLIARLYQLHSYSNIINKMIDLEKAKNEMPLDDVIKLIEEIENIINH